MKYYSEYTLTDGRKCILRNAEKKDGRAVLEAFIKAHEETDYLLTYPEENTFTDEMEGEFLQRKTDSENEAEIVAVVDGKVVGCAGIDVIGTKYKIRHRVEFGISILKEYWNLGIGSKLTDACISCAKEAGFKIMELSVVSDNEKAIALYKKKGFTSCGTFKKGFYSKHGYYQDIITMTKEL